MLRKSEYFPFNNQSIIYTLFWLSLFLFICLVAFSFTFQVEAHSLAMGVVESNDRYSVIAEIEGTIDIHCNPSDYVKENQLLATISGLEIEKKRSQIQQALSKIKDKRNSIAISLSQNRQGLSLELQGQIIQLQSFLASKEEELSKLKVSQSKIEEQIQNNQEHIQDSTHAINRNKKLWQTRQQSLFSQIQEKEKEYKRAMQLYQSGSLAKATLDSKEQEYKLAKNTFDVEEIKYESERKQLEQILSAAISMGKQLQKDLDTISNQIERANIYCKNGQEFLEIIQDSSGNITIPTKIWQSSYIQEFSQRMQLIQANSNRQISQLESESQQLLKDEENLKNELFNLEKSIKIYSPVSGYIGWIRAKRGDFVRTNDIIFEVAKSDTFLVVKAIVRNRDIINVEKGKKVNIYIKALEETKYSRWTGIFDSISHDAEATTSGELIYIGRVLFEEKKLPSLIKPGMNCSLHFESKYESLIQHLYYRLTRKNF